MALFKIYTLGQFKLSANEEPVELPSRPAQSLLAYLVLNAGAAHRREKLAGLLWPDTTEANARGYLRQALWRIRKSMQGDLLKWEDYLEISDIDIAFIAGSNYWLDADEFLKSGKSIDSEELIEIIQLYRGEFLPGFYDEWVDQERDRVQANYHQKMDLLSDQLIQSQRWEEAIKWGEEWIRFGHSPEPAFRALLRAYAGLGNQNMVGSTYQRCVEGLERELGVEPSVVTQELYEHLLAGEEELQPLPLTSASKGKASPPPFLNEPVSYSVERDLFVAREKELKQLEEFLNISLSNQGRVVFVVGEAGSGKTTLINEFTHLAQEDYDDLIVVSGNCNAHTGIGDPYLPFREIIEQLAGDVEAHWAAGAMTREHASKLWNIFPLTAQALVEKAPDLVDTFVPGIALLARAESYPIEENWLDKLSGLLERRPDEIGVGGQYQKDLFEQYARVLQALAQEAPLLLVVDDLQWADLGSISLLFHLVRQLSGHRILIVGAYRPEDIAQGRDGARHPLEPVANEFQRDFGEIIINIDQAERRAFLEALLESEPNQLEDSFSEMLFKQTQGQPLFTIELLRGMQERGDLIKNEAGQWVEREALDWETLPVRVEAVIAERIGRLSPSGRETLRAASVEGEIFTAEVVAEVLGTDKQALLDCLSSELERKHRLVRGHSILRIGNELVSFFRFKHNLFQRYLYNSLSEIERVRMHERFGNFQEELYGDLGENQPLLDAALQLARHFEEAGVENKAIYYLQQAGERALRLSAFKDAANHLGRGLNLVQSLPESPERDQQEFALQLSFGQACVGIEGPSVPEARKAFTRARELCQRTGETDQLLRVLGEQAIYFYVCSEYMQALELSDEIHALAQEIKDPIQIILSKWYLGFLNSSLGNFVKAREYLKEVIAFYDPKQHHHNLLMMRMSDPGPSAMAYDALCLWCLGYPEQALSRSQEALSLAHEFSHAFTLADVLQYGGCLFHFLRQDAEKIKGCAEELIDLADDLAHSWRGAGLPYWGVAMVMDGHVQEGIRNIEEGFSILDSLSTLCYRSALLSFLVKAYALQGQFEEAEKVAVETFELIEKTGERFWEAEIYRARGNLNLDMGEEEKAEADFLKAVEIARSRQGKMLELRATIDLANLWHRKGRTGEARKILDEIYSWFKEGFDEPDLIEAGKLLKELSD